VISRPFARRFLAIPFRDANAPTRCETLESEKIKAGTSALNSTLFSSEVVKERRVVSGCQRKIEFGGGVTFVRLLAGL
jgi:hypothetical protein